MGYILKGCFFPNQNIKKTPTRERFPYDVYTHRQWIHDNFIKTLLGNVYTIFFCHWNCFYIQYYYITIVGLLVTSRLMSWSNRMKCCTAITYSKLWLPNFDRNTTRIVRNTKQSNCNEICCALNIYFEIIKKKKIYQLH